MPVRCLRNFAIPKPVDCLFKAKYSAQRRSYFWDNYPSTPNKCLALELCFIHCKMRILRSVLIVMLALQAAIPSHCAPTCGPGTFRDSSKCTPCSPNTFAAFAFSQHCEPCPPGTSSDQSGAIVCKLDNGPCPNNHFLNNKGRCMTCGIGFRLDMASKTCKACLKNETSLGGAVTTCSKCPSGALFEPQLKDCLCEPGLVPTTDGNCRKCPAGTKRSHLSSGPVCEQCFQGTFSDKKGAAECIECPEDTFQPLPGQTKCLPCPPGSIGRKFGRTFCVSPKTNCPLGQKRVVRPGRPFHCEQKPCPPGTFPGLGGNGEPICDKCFPGEKFDPMNKRCESCGEKEVSEGGVVTKCTMCPNGLFRYRPEGNTCRCVESGYGLRNGRCEKCPKGTVSLYYKLACTKCPKGTFTDGEGSISSCRICPKNTFADEEGSAECKPCPDGTVSYGLGEATCVKVSRN